MRPSRAASLLVALLLLPLTGRAAGAQAAPGAEDVPVESRSVRGRVTRPGPGGERAAPGAWVVLHRIASEGAGPLDSMRTDAQGRFAFTYRARGDDALHFVSSSWAGIAYFSSPLRQADVREPDADIAVFDTASRGVRLTARGRHLVVSAVDSAGKRSVVDIAEISNDTTLTAVGSDQAPVWTVPLPNDAQRPRVGQGDVSADAVTFRAGRALVSAPISPGVKQLAISYEIEGDALPLSVPLEQPTEVLEVLVEDPTATVEGATLRQVDPVSIEGRNFVRWLAQDVPANAVVRIAVTERPDAKGSQLRYAIIATLGFLMLGILVVALRRRDPRSVFSTFAPPAESERIARLIADLDEAHERRSDASEAEVAGYRAERARLKAALGDALARERPRT